MMRACRCRSPRVSVSSPHKCGACGGRVGDLGGPGQYDPDPPLRAFHVVRVNGDPQDIYAALSLDLAVEAADVDAGDTIECGVVKAHDAGAARLLAPKTWTTYVIAED